MERSSTQGHEKSNRGSFPLVRMTFDVGLEWVVARNFPGRCFAALSMTACSSLIGANDRQTGQNSLLGLLAIAGEEPAGGG
jgi:hypothetical protein